MTSQTNCLLVILEDSKVKLDVSWLGVQTECGRGRVVKATD